MAKWKKIEKAAKRNNRKVLFPKLDSISNLAILCTQQQEIGNIKDFFPAALKIDTYYFHDGKRSADADENNFFSSDTSILGIPSKKVVTHFCEEPYDLLINFCERTVFYTEYLGAKSKAKFKIAKSGDHPFGFDLFIKTEQTNNSLFVEEIIKTLKSLKH